MNRTINIKVIIADRPYRLKVTPKEEEVVRKAAKLIKQKMKELTETYGATDKQDYLAMTALLLCTDLLKIETNLKQEDTDLKEKLDQLDDILTSFLDQG